METNKQKKANYTIIYDWMFGLEVSPREINLYAIIRGFEDNGHGCFISNDKLAKKLNVSVKQIEHCLKNLRGAGLVGQWKEGRKRHLKTILPKDIKEEPVEEPTPITEEESLSPNKTPKRVKTVTYDPTEHGSPFDPQQYM